MSVADLGYFSVPRLPNLNRCPYPVVDSEGNESLCGRPCASPENRKSRACLAHAVAWTIFQRRMSQRKKSGLRG